MPRNEIGELRRTAVVGLFGPGSIVDFRSGTAPVSAVVAGLEEWDRRGGGKGLSNEQTIAEPRLQRRLGVAGFRLPPVDPGTGRGRGKNKQALGPRLPAVRFPAWLQCPTCHSLKMASRWSSEPGNPGRWCGPCSAKAPGRQRIWVIPVRFIVACDRGHLDEFPWHWWVQHRDECETNNELQLKSEGAGLAGLKLRCRSCGAVRDMDGIFRRGGLEGLRCRGRQPWLAAPDEECDRAVRTLQRGASNVYFPKLASALSIPPWSDRIQEALGIHWAPIANVSLEQRPTLIRDLSMVLPDDIGMSPEELAEAVEQRKGVLERSGDEDLKVQEYRQFTGPDVRDPEFEARTERVPEELAPWLSRLSRVVRLREVRAQEGFSRIRPPEFMGTKGGAIAALSASRMNWLPAIEVRGEGIFFELSPEALQEWEEREPVVDRANRIQHAVVLSLRERYGDDVEVNIEISPRFLLIHSLAHALMKQLSLECGYSSASLRERVYASRGEADMHGLLIYTAAPDSDGTLGGLVRQGLPERVREFFPAAIRDMEWCSSDPLCITGVGSSVDTMNLAACHSCVLAPETSCEEFNRYLDRALLTGMPDGPEIGFFRSLVHSGA